MLLRTRRYADRVIVVDEGSIDHTVEVAELVGAEVVSTRRTGEGATFENCLE